MPTTQCEVAARSAWISATWHGSCAQARSEQEGHDREHRQEGGKGEDAGGRLLLEQLFGGLERKQFGLLEDLPETIFAVFAAFPSPARCKG